MPQDARVEQSQDEKFEKYQDLARKIRRIWHIKVKVMPLIVGALGTVPMAFKTNLEETAVGVGIDLLSPFFLVQQQS